MLFYPVKCYPELTLCCAQHKQKSEKYRFFLTTCSFQQSRSWFSGVRLIKTLAIRCRMNTENFCVGESESIIQKNKE